jgi:glyoxylase-like metal-dependent hydrolase (beta-lactamase superfamily II)
VSNLIRIGELEVIALDDVRDSTFPLEDAFPGVQLEDWERYRPDYPALFADAVTMRNRVGAFVIRGSGRIMLVDTGLGSGVPGAGLVLDELTALGITAESVQTVLLTHAHADHIGGVLNESSQPMFGNARHVISQTEWATMAERARETMARLEAEGLLETFTDEDALGAGFRLVPLPGHTPGQYGVLIEDQLLIAADAVHHPAQLDQPEWHTPFDADTIQAIQTRTAMTDRILHDGLLLAASHFPARFGRVVDRDARRIWQAVAGERDEPGTA